jgi:hypothetical protein
MNSMSQINIYSYNVAAHGCVKGRETMRIKIGLGMKTNPTRISRKSVLRQYGIKHSITFYDDLSTYCDILGFPW